MEGPGTGGLQPLALAVVQPAVRAKHSCGDRCLELIKDQSKLREISPQHRGPAWCLLISLVLMLLLFAGGQLYRQVVLRDNPLQTIKQIQTKKLSSPKDRVRFPSIIMCPVSDSPPLDSQTASLFALNHAFNGTGFKGCGMKEARWCLQGEPVLKHLNSPTVKSANCPTAKGFKDCIFYDTSDLIPLKPQVSDNKLELLFMVSTRKDHRHILSRGLRWTGTNHRGMNLQVVHGSWEDWCNPKSEMQGSDQVSLPLALHTVADADHDTLGQQYHLNIKFTQATNLKGGFCKTGLCYFGSNRKKPITTLKLEEHGYFYHNVHFTPDDAGVGYAFVLVGLTMDDWVTQLIDVEPVDYAAIISLCASLLGVILVIIGGCCYHDPAPIPDGNKRLRDCFHLMWPNALFRLPRRLHLIPEPVLVPPEADQQEVESPPRESVLLSQQSQKEQLLKTPEQAASRPDKANKG